MSWEASGFVKKLHKNITVTEKFVLLILADYHRTDERYGAWPSQDSIARDCLMTPRAIRRILSHLEEKKFIEKLSGGCGRGNVTAYRILGLEKEDPETRFVETGFTKPGFPVHEKRTLGAIKEDPTGNAIRKEPIKQPIQEPRKTESSERLFPTTEVLPPKQKPKIPEWVPPDAWASFVEMRKLVKAPLTDRAMELAVGALDKLRASGNDPRAVLEQSVLHNWKGLFAVKEDFNGNGRQNRGYAKQQQNIAAVIEGFRGGGR